MKTLREAATLALQSMDQMLTSGEWYCAKKRADALRAALAKPERRFSCPICAGAMREWQSLTDEEIWTAVDDCKGSVPRFARAIEAALKERNT